MSIEAYRVQNSNGTTNVHSCFSVVKAQSVRIKMQSIWAFACSPEAMVLLMLCADCMQLLIFPKPKYYCNVKYPSQKNQAEVYQRPKNTASQVFTPFLTKKCPKRTSWDHNLDGGFFSTRSSVHAAETSQRLPCGQQQKQIFQLTEWVLRGLSSQLWKNWKTKKRTLCRRVMRDRLWFYSDTVQALEKGLHIVS